MSIKQTLEAAKKLLEAGWTQNTYARDEFGAKLSWDDPRATCFCLMGAIRRAGDVDELAVDYICTFHAKTCPGLDDPVVWNDQPSRTKEEALSFLSSAIEHAPN